VSVSSSRDSTIRRSVRGRRLISSLRVGGVSTDSEDASTDGIVGVDGRVGAVSQNGAYRKNEDFRNRFHRLR
jgi:hypothetical protein